MTVSGSGDSVPAPAYWLCIMRALSLVQRLGNRASLGYSTRPPPRPLSVCRSMFAGPGSEQLRQRSCQGGVCSKDTPLVPASELPELLAAVPSWTLDKTGNMLIRKFTAKNFMAAIRFFNKVAEVAESESHHPDLHLTNYREVEVHVCTHVVNGLTIYDFVLAAKLDTIEVEYSPKWLQQAQAQVASVPSS